MRLTSTVFADNGAIPAHYTCNGANVSPGLRIVDVPEDAASLALICDDPDAATDPDGPGKVFDHWVVFDIAPGTAEIPDDSVPAGAVEGANTMGQVGYTGPCPPNGQHRYYFKLYALDTSLGLAEGAGKEQVEAAMDGHVLADVHLLGLYEQ
jgi:Raf kinase inhibitor-like YbhB/YbcL family protein